MLQTADYPFGLFHDERVKTRWFCIAVLAVLIACSHDVFELTFDKKAGLPFLREGSLAALLIFTAYFLLRYPGILKLKLGAAVLAYTALFISLSALLSWWWFDQPPRYAVLEERRVLSMLWFFPALAFVLRQRASSEEIERAFLVAGATLTLYSLLYYLHVIPDNNVASDIFIEQYFYATDDPRNSTRYVVGSSLLAVVIPLIVLIAVRNWRERRDNRWPLLVLLGCLFTLLAVDQSRSLLLGISVGIFFALLAQISPRWKPVLACAAILLLFAVGALLLGTQNEKLQWLLNSLLTGQGVRNHTSRIILQVLGDTWFWGHGALSIQYEHGFLAIYNDNFWLNDVGKLGLLYRFGFFTVIFAAFYLYALRFLFNAKRQLQTPLLSAFAWVYAVTLLMPWGSTLTLLPAELGIALGLSINRASAEDEERL